MQNVTAILRLYEPQVLCILSRNDEFGSELVRLTAKLVKNKWRTHIFKINQFKLDCNLGKTKIGAT